MKDYILIPNIINNIKSDIHSSILSVFLKDSEEDGDKISLDKIRKLYIEDRALFFLTIDELMLRGFQFYTEKSNNILPKTDVDLSVNIDVYEDLKRYTAIKWEKFGLGGFEKRFSVKSDLFFNKIPLSGFQEINRSIDLKAFAIHLQSLNFSITNLGYNENIRKPDVAPDEIIAETTPEYINYSESRYFIVGFFHKLISEAFNESKYNDFVMFCNDENIFNMNELKSHHLETYKNKELVTEYRFNLVVDKFKTVIFESFRQEKLKDYEKILIEEFFTGNEYRLFRGFSKSIGLEDARDVNEEHIKKFSFTPKVGVRKVRDVERKLKNLGDYIESRKNSLLFLDDTFIKLKNDYIKELKIKELFQQSNCGSFLSYCDKNKLINLADVRVIHINQFAIHSGVNREVFYNVYTVFKELEQSDSNTSELIFSAGSFYDEIKSFTIKDVSLALNLTSLDNCSSMMVSDLEGVNLSIYTDSDKVNFLYGLSQKIMSIIPPKEIFAKAINELNEREFHVLRLRLEELLTLEDIGEELNVTRERVRQIQKVIVSKILKIFEENNFRNSLELYCDGKPFIYYSDISQIFEEGKFLIEIFKTDYLYYEENMDAFFLEESQRTSYLDEIQEILNELPDVFTITNYSESFKEIIDELHLGLKHWRKLLVKNGYKEYGDLYSLNRLNASEIVEKVFQTFFKHPVKLDEESFLEIRKLAKKHFNFSIGESLRSFDNRIREADKLLLVDSNTYMFFDPEEDEYLYKEIEEYIDNVLDERQVINTEEIFLKFEKKLSEIKVRNKIHLYSLIKYYFEDKYTIGKGNTLNIYNNEGAKLNIDDRLVNFIEKQGGIVTKQTIENKLKWKRYKIDLAISSSERIITWDTNTVRLYDSIKMTTTQREKLLQVIKENMPDDYTTTAIIYEQMLFDPELSHVLRDNEIDKNFKLSSIVKLLNPKIKGHQNFLYLENSTYRSFTDVLKDQFQDKVSREDIFNFIKNYGYKELMAYHHLNELVDSNVLLEVDIGMFYPTSKLSFPEGTREKLLNLIRDEMGVRPYITLTDLEGFRGHLPDINIRWTPHVIKSLLLNEGFRHIKRNPYDYRFDKLILVKDVIDITTFEELVHYILINEYNGNMHEMHVYDFIASKGMLDEKMYDNEKQLPNEIKRESEYVNVDELGIVSLKGV